MIRIKKLQSVMDTDAALITSPVNRRYYTGFASSAGTLVLTPDESVLVIDSRYFEAAKAAAKVDRVIMQDKPYEQVAEILRGHGAKTVAVESGSITLAAFYTWRDKLPKMKLIGDDALTKLITRQRASKSRDEIACVREAQRLADKTFTYITGWMKPGMTEREVAVEMEFYSRREGSQAPSFDFIVAGGANSALPHAVPGDYQIRSGDFVVMDFGCTVDGYRSDMTRTIAMGQPNERQREVYALVLRAQLAALEAIRAGKICSSIDRVARDIIDSTKYGGLFGHGLGHSLGLEIHEPPRLAKSYDEELPENCIVSVEPGVYLPGEFGVRIEDIVVATPEGHENLTKTTKELIIL